MSLSCWDALHCFRIVYVPEEFLIEDEDEEELNTLECGDIDTEIGVDDVTYQSDDINDLACLSDIQEHIEE